MFRLQFDPSKPIYVQIIQEIERALARGDLALGAKLPSQRDLAAELAVNPNTVQRAYREMEHMGLVETLRGQGTFICKEGKAVESVQADTVREVVERFLAEMESLGCDKETILACLTERLSDDD